MNPQQSIKFQIEQIQDKGLFDLISNNHRLNNIQLDSIKQVLGSDTQGFSLIKGPPGTGKSTTIVGLVNVILLHKPASNFGTTFNASGKILVPTSVNQKSSRRILICAPSNAACDELVLKLVKGIYSTKNDISPTKNEISPKILRVGSCDAMIKEVRKYSLELFLENIDKNQKELRNQINHWTKKQYETNGNLRTAKEQRLLWIEKIFDFDDKKLKEIEEKVNHLSQELSKCRGEKDKLYKRIEEGRRIEIKKIFDETEIVCSTLTSSATEHFSKLGLTFDTLIIDESTQATELSSIIPLKYNPRRCKKNNLNEK